MTRCLKCLSDQCRVLSAFARYERDWRNYQELQNEMLGCAIASSYTNKGTQVQPVTLAMLEAVAMRHERRGR